MTARRPKWLAVQVKAGMILKQTHAMVLVEKVMKRRDASKTAWRRQRAVKINPCSENVLIYASTIQSVQLIALRIVLSLEAMINQINVDKHAWSNPIQVLMTHAVSSVLNKALKCNSNLRVQATSISKDATIVVKKG